jgi:hypothetical protein
METLPVSLNASRMTLSAQESQALAGCIGLPPQGDDFVSRTHIAPRR